MDLISSQCSRFYPVLNTQHYHHYRSSITTEQQQQWNCCEQQEWTWWNSKNEHEINFPLYMSYNCVRSYSATDGQLLFINNKYTFCQIAGNTRVQNKAEKTTNWKLPNLPIFRSRSRPTTRSQGPNRSNSLSSLWQLIASYTDSK